MPKRSEVTDEAIGALVREKRHAREMGQPELGKALGVSAMMVQKYETGTSPLTVVRLLKIAKTLKCDYTDLIP